MTDQYIYRDPGRRNGGSTLAGVVIAVLAGMVALGVFVHHARSGFAGRLAAAITGRPLTSSPRRRS